MSVCLSVCLPTTGCWRRIEWRRVEMSFYPPYKACVIGLEYVTLCYVTYARQSIDFGFGLRYLLMALMAGAW